MIEFFVNNGRKIRLKQNEPDGIVNVTTWKVYRDGTQGCENAYTITPGDFVMMLNRYRYQKRNGNKTLDF